MYNHGTKEDCFICPALAGDFGDQTWIRENDIFYRDDLVMGYVSSKFAKGNEGHAIIVPVEHIENLYDVSQEVGAALMKLSSRVAQALKVVRNCDGVTVVQNNEPAGDQHAFHYHMHIVPRFEGDNFQTEFFRAERSADELRPPYAEALRKELVK